MFPKKFALLWPLLAGVAMVAAASWFAQAFADPAVNVSPFNDRAVAQLDNAGQGKSSQANAGQGNTGQGNSGQGKAGEGPKNQPSKPKRPFRITREREAAALAFVEEQHSELTELLTNLKKKDKTLYANAIGQLHRDSQRLATMYDNDQKRYEIELRKWQANSRVQLLAARLQMSDSPKLREELKTHIAARRDAKIALTNLERERTAKRLAWLEKQIKEMKTGRDVFVERQLQDLIKAANVKTSVKQGEKKR